ncbi:MAG: hypothetical protein C4291_06335 [Candidatus Dadabacteria bacterium]
MKKGAESSGVEHCDSDTVTLRWSEVLKSAFDYYYSKYIPAWALNKTHFNNIGDKVFIWKQDGKWVSWEGVDLSERPDIVTLFDLLPDLPEDREYWEIMRELECSGIKEPEDYFWENIFSYRHASEIEVNRRRYRIDWEA